MPMSPEELERRRAAANPPKDDAAELLESGQEEVFSRTEVEAGRIEHAIGERDRAIPMPDDTAGPEQIRRDEDQTERQAPDSASPGEAAGR
jgi:hypothetical protein